MKEMKMTFTVTEGLKRGVRLVSCIKSDDGEYIVFREANSFRTPTVSRKFKTEMECTVWASQFMKQPTKKAP